MRYLPSATAAWRLNLLRSGGLPDAQLAGIRWGVHSCRRPAAPAPGCVSRHLPETLASGIQTAWRRVTRTSTNTHMAASVH